MSRIAASCLALAIVLSGTPARAQTPEELEAARALFAEGVQATQDERWDDAADRFRRVMRVRATGQVKYNLALALSHTGEIAEAAALLREVVDDRELDRRTRRDARTLLAGIEPRLGHLTVRLEGDEAGVAITLDGEPLGLDRVGTPFEVDPGEHRLALRRGDREVGARTVTVGAGESAEASLVETSVRESDQADDLLADTQPVAPAGRSVIEEWWFWTIVGAIVVVGVGVGVGAAVASSGPSAVQGNLSPGVLEVMLP